MPPTTRRRKRSSLFSIGRDPRLNHVFEVDRGVLQAQASSQLGGFSSATSKKKKPRTQSP